MTSSSDNKIISQKSKKETSKKSYSAYMSYYAQDGTKKYKKFYGKTQAEANKKRDIAQYEYDHGISVISPKVKALPYMLQLAEIYYGNEGIPIHRDRINSIKKVLAPVAELEIGKIKQSQLQQSINQLAEYLSQGSLRLYICRTSALFEKAIKDGVINSNPLKDCTIPQGASQPHSRRSLTTKEREVFLEEAGRDDRFLPFLVIYYCGLRPGEVCALQGRDVDLKNQLIHVRQAVKRTGKIGSPKSASGVRDIPIPQALLEHLLRHEATTMGFYFHSPKCKYYHSSTLRKLWERNLLPKMLEHNKGIATIGDLISDELTPYYLRHTYCTRLAELNVPLRTAQYLMGHSSITMTAKVYTHVTNTMIDTAADILRHAR